MELIKTIKCPYCGVENKIIINIENVIDKQVQLCDCEEGGCDRYFVAFTKIKVECDVKKIEGC